MHFYRLQYEKSNLRIGKAGYKATIHLHVDLTYILQLYRGIVPSVFMTKV